MNKKWQKSIFNFSHIPKKLKIDFEITKNRIELFEVIKNWKLNWKLPKNQFSIFFVIRKIKNWIENCPKSIFIFLKLLKIEQNEIDVFVHGCKSKKVWNILSKLM